nr:replication endonuclease [Pseudomaricurvus alkylphenolicus]
MSADDVVEVSRVKAGVCAEEFKVACESDQVEDAIQESADVLQAIVEAMGLEWPVNIKPADTEEMIRTKQLGACHKVQEEKWWRRRLRVLFARQTEQVMRLMGFVRKGKSPYVSNWAYKRWLGQQWANRKLLAGMEVESLNRDGGMGEVLPLLEAVEASVSNPEHRHDELMTRMRGWEEIAQALDLKGLFLTITCPSKYHAQNYNGSLNKKYKGATPRDANDYLCSVWANIRSEWHREGIRCFGFRVVEPHQDGTPHWHLVLFFSPFHAARAVEIFGDHAMREDGDENGAEGYRWDVTEIDPNKGSAVAYIAKYISKNIAGKGVVGDWEGGISAADGAMRVRAWASTWNIRQFQQIGTASVTVWRELRRLRDPLDGEYWDETTAEAVRAAADKGDWAMFVDLMGGAFAARQKPKAHSDAEAELETAADDPMMLVPARSRGRVDTAKRNRDEKKTQAAKDRWSIKIKNIEMELVADARMRVRKAMVTCSLYEKQGVQRLKTLSALTENEHGDEVTKVIGVVMRNVSRLIKTRDKVWTVQPLGTVAARTKYDVAIARSAQRDALDLCQ